MTDLHTAARIDDLSQDDRLKLTADFFHRIIVHFALWFTEDAVSKNWLANDEIRFQRVEFSRGMNDAECCNDSCRAHFSPFEAWSVKRLLEWDESPGLAGPEVVQKDLFNRSSRSSTVAHPVFGHGFSGRCRGGWPYGIFRLDTVRSIQ